MKDWILISKQLPKQFTTEQNIRIMVGIIKMPLHSNIVSASIAATHNWFSVPTKKQLYDQRASICELPSVVSFALAPSGSGKGKSILFLILLFSIISCVQKTIVERSFGIFPEISTSVNFKGSYRYSFDPLINVIVKNSEAVEEG